MPARRAHAKNHLLKNHWTTLSRAQPPHPGFFLGEGMSEPPKPRIVHRDTLAPTFRSLTASTRTLWPPNHRMVQVSLQARLVDLLDRFPRARIVSVTSNEPVNGQGDGHTSPDWIITGPMTVALRAERSERGNGRVYTIKVDGTDAAGNVASQSITVNVPRGRHHSR